MAGVAVVDSCRTATVTLTVTEAPLASRMVTSPTPGATAPNVIFEPLTAATMTAMLLLTAAYGDAPPMIVKSCELPIGSVRLPGAVVDKGTVWPPPDVAPGEPPPPPQAAISTANIN